MLPISWEDGNIPNLFLESSNAFRGKDLQGSYTVTLLDSGKTVVIKTHQALFSWNIYSERVVETDDKHVNKWMNKRVSPEVWLGQCEERQQRDRVCSAMPLRKNTLELIPESLTGARNVKMCENLYRGAKSWGQESFVYSSKEKRLGLVRITKREKW